MSRSTRKHDKRLARAKQKAKEGPKHGRGYSKPQKPPSIFPGFRRKTVEEALRRQR